MVVEKGFKQTNFGEVPIEWELIQLGEIAIIKDGTHQTPKYFESGIPFYSVENVTSNDFNNTKYISELEHSFLTRHFRIEKGDVLMTRIGSIGDCKYVDWNPNASFYVSLALLKFNNPHIAKYFYHFSKSNFFKKEIELNSLQHAVPKKINLGNISIVRILIPNTEIEQTAIANALSDMDALIVQTEKLIEKKKAIKQGVMQELLKPKEGWVPKKLGENALILRGGSPRPIEDYLTTSSDGINWIKIGDVDKNAKYITSTEEKITPDGMSRSRVVKPGDFLLSNSMSFGRPYIMQIDGCIHDGWLVITEYESNFDRDFLYYVLGSEAVFTQYKSMASGSSVLNLNKEIVKEVNVICPISLDEQRYIAGVLSDIDIDLDFTETKLQKLKYQKQGMMQALLTGKIRLI